MAKQHGLEVEAMFQHWDITEGLRGLTISGQKELADTTYVGQRDRTFIEGMRSANLNFNGIFSKDDDTYRDFIERAYFIGPREIAIAFGDVGSGATALMSSALCTGMGMSSPLNDVAMVDGDFQLVEEVRPSYLMYNGHWPIDNPPGFGASTPWIDLGDDDWDNKLVRIHVRTAPSGNMTVRLQETDDISGTPTISTKRSFTVGGSSKVVTAYENTTTSTDLGRYVRFNHQSTRTMSFMGLVHVSNNL